MFKNYKTGQDQQESPFPLRLMDQTVKTVVFRLVLESKILKVFIKRRTPEIILVKI